MSSIKNQNINELIELDPLHIACQFGLQRQIQLIMKFLKKNKKQDLINSKDKSGLPVIHTLLQASEDGTPDIFEEFLCEDILDLNITDKDGNSLLHIAAQKGQERILEILYEKRINQIDFNLQNNNGYSPIISAIIEGQFNTFLMLLEKSDKNLKDKNGLGAFHHAAITKGNSQKYIKALVDAGWNINVQDPMGNTPLDLVLQQSVNKNIRSIDILIQNGAKQNKKQEDVQNQKKEIKIQQSNKDDQGKQKQIFDQQKIQEKPIGEVDLKKNQKNMKKSESNLNNSNENDLIKFQLILIGIILSFIFYQIAQYF